MNGQSEENLRELIEKFADTEQTQIYLEEIRAGDEILKRNPAPEPDDMLVANIKAEIALRVLPKKTKVLKLIAHRILAAAATIVIITAISTNFIDDKPTDSPGTYSNNDSIELAAAFLPNFFSTSSTTTDATSEYYTIEIEMIESELIALQSEFMPTSRYEGTSNIDNALDEFEMDLAEMSSDFWEG